MHRTGSLDDEITARVAKATAAFGCLRKRLWDDHGIQVDTKVQVYRAVVLTTLLYGSETWTLYRRHVKKLDSFHLRCVRRILHIKWQDRVPYTTVPEQCDTTDIESILFRTRFRWSGHVSCMSDERIPKHTLYGQLPNTKRSAKRYKDQLRVNMKTCNIDCTKLESLAADRSQWRRLCYSTVEQFEQQRIDSHDSPCNRKGSHLHKLVYFSK